MEKPKDLLCLEGISCMSFNKDFTACVLSKKDKNLYIYSLKKLSDTTSWELAYTLTGHLQYISAVDWHPQTNIIISSSHDRNILVWNFDNSKNIWNPELVYMMVKVSILDIKWSNRGDKFVATTGSKIVATGYYDNENKWWTCMQMKEHKSSVTCARFDASGLFILSGSTDLKAYISSSYVPGLDDKYLNEPKPFELEKKFGFIVMNFPLSGWVNSVNWSPSGNYAYIATHDAGLTIVDTKNKSSSTIYVSHSPISSIIQISDNLICVVGFDRHIYQYCLNDNLTWTYKKCLTKEDSLPQIVTRDAISEPFSSSIQDRLKQFQGGFGQSKKQSFAITTTSQKNIHSANINSVNLVSGKSLITSDFAGFVKVWNI